MSEFAYIVISGEAHQAQLIALLQKGYVINTLAVVGKSVHYVLELPKEYE